MQFFPETSLCASEIDKKITFLNNMCWLQSLGMPAKYLTPSNL